MSAEKKLLYPVAGSPGMLLWWCPGCREAHGVWTEAPNAHTGAKWGFNGDLMRPTFTPSILTRGTKFSAKGEAQYAAWSNGEIECPEHFDSIPTVCHVFIRNGQIQYLADCTHALAGKTVPMEAF